MSLTPHPDELAGREVLLLGLGAFGGGAGCARALARRGARLTISDLRPASALSESLASLKDIAFDAAFGGHPDELFERAEVVVVNPAVPETAPALARARAAGCVVTTQVNLALQLAREVPAVAITGTHGKSSTASLIHHLLRDLPGRTVLGGNVGGSLLEQVDGLGPQDRLIVELSSFQLERLHAPPGWPRVALFTCLRPDHLDRHGDFATYAAAKARLLEFQDAESLALFPADEASLKPFHAQARGRLECLDGAALDPATWGLTLDELPWSEPYRASALLLAVRAACELGLAADQVGAALRDFPGLPHRLQELPAPPGVRWIDNGIATHPEPTAVALDALEGPVVLVVGGYDKSLPLGELPARALACHAVHLFGAGGARLLDATEPAARPHWQQHPDCRRAIEAALRAVPASGGTLLFSPSFASFDEFRNFRDRAELFQNLCATFPTEQQKTPGDERSAPY